MKNSNFSSEFPVDFESCGEGSGDGGQKLRGLVLGVGNSLKGDDGAGPLLCELLEEHPVSGWEAVDGGASPENVLRHVRERRPPLVLVVDAAHLELAPGEMRFVDKERMATMGLMSTHHLPMSFLMEELERDVERVIFLGVQPGTMEFCEPVGEPIRKAVYRVRDGLATGLSDIPWLE